MNRRSFFRFVAGGAAWLATKHVAWAFPEPQHVWCSVPLDSVYWLQIRKNAIDNMILDMLAQQDFLFRRGRQ